MDKIKTEQLICNQSEFCDACEHAEKHTRDSDCEGCVCDHFGKYAECVTPENVIKKSDAQTQLEQILERVEEGTTTVDDADVLREALRKVCYDCGLDEHVPDSCEENYQRLAKSQQV